MAESYLDQGFSRFALTLQCWKCQPKKSPGGWSAEFQSAAVREIFGAWEFYTPSPQQMNAPNATNYERWILEYAALELANNLRLL